MSCCYCGLFCILLATLPATQELCTRRWRWACGDTGCDRHAPRAQGPQSWDEHAAVHHETGSLELLSVAQTPKLPISSLASVLARGRAETSKCSLFAQLEHRCRVQGAAKDTLIQRSKPAFVGRLTTSCNTWCEPAESGALPVVNIHIAASIEIPWCSNMKPSDASRIPKNLQIISTCLFESSLSRMALNLRSAGQITAGGAWLHPVLEHMSLQKKDMVSFLEVFQWHNETGNCLWALCRALVACSCQMVLGWWWWLIPLTIVRCPCSYCCYWFVLLESYLLPLELRLVHLSCCLVPFTLSLSLSLSSYSYSCSCSCSYS